MRVIGLTGGIGTGKSAVARILQELGAPLVDADAVTHHFQKRGAAAWRAIFQNFGWSVLTDQGDLDRRRLGWLIFGDEALRERLNGLVHPVVRSAVNDAIRDQERAGTERLVVDVPLLLELSRPYPVDEVWVVYAPEALQISRIMTRDGLSREAAWQRIRAQMPMAEKVRQADRVIDNTGSLASLKRQVIELWQAARPTC